MITLVFFILFLASLLLFIFYKNHDFSFFKDPAGICALCDKTLHEKTLRSFDDHIICNDHLEDLKNQIWFEYLCTISNADFSENGIKVYEFRHFLFRKFSIPSYLSVKYQINTDSKLIDSIVTLHICERDFKKVSEEAINFLT